VQRGAVAPRRSPKRADAYREKKTTVAEATGQAARFLKIYEEYKKGRRHAPAYVSGNHGAAVRSTDKIILDSGAGSGVVPILRLPS